MSIGWISLKSGTTVIPNRLRIHSACNSACWNRRIHAEIQLVEKIRQHQQTYRAKRNKRNRIGCQQIEFPVAQVEGSFLHSNLCIFPFCQPHNNNAYNALGWNSYPQNPLKINGWSWKMTFFLNEFRAYFQAGYTLFNLNGFARSIVPFLSSTSSVWLRIGPWQKPPWTCCLVAVVAKGDFFCFSSLLKKKGRKSYLWEGYSDFFWRSSMQCDLKDCSKIHQWSLEGSKPFGSWVFSWKWAHRIPMLGVHGCKKPTYRYLQKLRCQNVCIQKHIWDFSPSSFLGDSICPNIRVPQQSQDKMMSLKVSERKP